MFTDPREIGCDYLMPFNKAHDKMEWNKTNLFGSKDELVLGKLPFAMTNRKEPVQITPTELSRIV